MRLELKIAICDDEKQFIKKIEKCISKYMMNRDIAFEIDKFSSGEQFLQLGIDMDKYALVFMDINMSELNGIDTAKKIRECTEKVYIVFVTAYIDYALEGYEAEPIRYILKNNVNFEAAIHESMDAVMKKIHYSTVQKEFDFREGKVTISLNQLMYIESKLHILEFHINEKGNVKTYTMYGTLNEKAKDLIDFSFLRIHQSYLVNMRYIKSLERYKILLSNGQSLNVPKAKFLKVSEVYAAYKGEL